MARAEGKGVACRAWTPTKAMREKKSLRNLQQAFLLPPPCLETRYVLVQSVLELQLSCSERCSHPRSLAHTGEPHQSRRSRGGVARRQQQRRGCDGQSQSHGDIASARRASQPIIERSSPPGRGVSSRPPLRLPPFTSTSATVRFSGLAGS